MTKEYNNLVLVEYKLVSSIEDSDNPYKAPAEVGKLFDKCTKGLLKNKRNFDNTLKTLIEQYPQYPQFQNYLYVYYKGNSMNSLAKDLCKSTFANYPDYLYGRINYAGEMIKEGRFDEIPKILGEAMDLKMLYPERSAFHFDELMSFLNIAIIYFVETGDYDQAIKRLDVLKQISPESTTYLNCKDLVDGLLLKKAYDRFKKENETKRTPAFIGKKQYAQKKNAPVLENRGIYQLYEVGLEINSRTIKEILELPRESLIQDLRKVLMDSIERYDYFSEDVSFDLQMHSFPLHALLLLTTIKAEEALPELLEILRQDVKFLQLWFDDVLSEVAGLAVTSFAENKLEVLKDFILEEGNTTFARTGISIGVAGIAHEKRDKRHEVIEWYKKVFDKFIEGKVNDGLIDTDLIGFMLCDVLDLKAFELAETAKELYEEGLVGLGIVGDYKAFVKDLNSTNNRYKHKPFDIYEFYKSFERTEMQYKPTAKKNPKQDFIGNEYPELPELFRNIGRNDPCPCGSGKKYKKCHGASAHAD